MLTVLLLAADTPQARTKIEKLYDKYNRLMYVVAYRILGHHEDAEDAVLFSWEKIIKHIDDVPELPGDLPYSPDKAGEDEKKENEKICNKIRSFLVIIVERTSIDMLRKRHADMYADIDELETTPFVATKDNSYEDVEMKMVLNGLPKKYAEVMILYFVHGMAYKDIADILSLSMSAVTSRIARGKEMLKKTFEV